LVSLGHLGVTSRRSRVELWAALGCSRIAFWRALAISWNFASRLRARPTFALGGFSPEASRALFPGPGATQELDVGFSEFCVSPARRAQLRLWGRPRARAVFVALPSRAASSPKIAVFRKRSFRVRETMTFVAPRVSAALSRGRPGANRASFGAPSPPWSSTLDFRKFASRQRARPSYNPRRLCAPTRFSPCVEVLVFFRY